MKAAEHYRKAEQLLETETAHYNGGQTRRTYPPSERDVARAAVHAKLAEVALLLEQR